MLGLGAPVGYRNHRLQISPRLDRRLVQFKLMPGIWVGVVTAPVVPVPNSP